MTNDIVDLEVFKTRKQNYIITWNADSYQLHGPFANGNQIFTYGQWWQAKSGDGSGDDPRWRSIYIGDPHAKPKVWQVMPSLELTGDLYMLAMPQLMDRFEIHGPFANMEQLEFYGTGWSAYADDDGWQSVSLKDPGAAPTIITPDAQLWDGDDYAGFSYHDSDEPLEPPENLPVLYVPTGRDRDENGNIRQWASNEEAESAMHELMERLFDHPSTADGGFILVGPEVVFVCIDVKERSVVESRPVKTGWKATALSDYRL